MFLRYVSSMKSWILMFAILIGLTNVLLLLDKGIALQIGSIVYLDSVLLITFIIFFLWRYLKEMHYLRMLEARTRDMSDNWLEALPTPVHARDKIVSEALYAVNRFHKQKLSDMNTTHKMESDYIASWVHEIKAPLTAMKLIIDANQHVRIMQKIEAEWLRIYLLVDRQLYISRMPTLRSDYVLEKTYIQRLVAKEVRDLASWCMEKNIAVEFKGEEAEVITDIKWCRFIIRQLLMNAVKYSPEGGTLLISTEILPAGNVILYMKDEGPGIPAHDLPRIFDKGFTGGNGRIYNAATGLGLYLARNVATMIGITLDAQSGQTNGTVMRMIFSTKNDFEAFRE
ncbi:sensor histidine kinase [Bacillus sp. 3255]|uniref:sensor histidine kinase n=1 Tax=Bacillus sp. 3255 TaxID=2817904 RepID=UPI002854F29D|nr:sensor histidine kinase [Bacillus sp. 3255]MDR6885229.1 OmpR family two-component system bacitracin resistance sensor histidine kinase BceS [Bacillus sp. 3255]